MEFDFAPYGIRPSEKGWRRSTSYHPYEFRERTAEEKRQVSASGTGKRLLEQSKEPKRDSAQQSAGDRAATRAGYGGQGRSPFDRSGR